MSYCCTKMEKQHHEEEVNTYTSGIHLKSSAKLDFDFQSTAHRGRTSPPLDSGVGDVFGASV
jgi:hypothetical protein